MQKYKESIDIESGSLEAGGADITRVIENKDPKAKDSGAPAPVFDDSRSKSSIPPVRTLQSDLESVVKGGASLSKTFVEKHDTPQGVPVKPGTKQASGQGFGNKHAPHKAAPIQAKKKKPEATAKEPRTNRNSAKNTAITALSVLFLLGAGYLSLPLFGVKIPSLLPVKGNAGVDQKDGIELPAAPLRNITETKIIAIGGRSRSDILGDIDAVRTSEANGLGATTVFFTVEAPATGGDSEPGTHIASIEEFLSATEISAGPILPRSIESYTFGTLPNGNTFLVAKVRSFEEALGALYDWEGGMASDLYGVLQFDVEAARKEGEFEDALVENQNVRVLYNDKGEDAPAPGAESVLAYSFPTTDMLIIGSSLETIKSVYSILKIE